MSDRWSFLSFCFAIIALGFALFLLPQKGSDPLIHTERELIHWVCDAENENSDGTMSAIDHPDTRFNDAKNRVEGISHSGNYSIYSDSVSPYVMTITISDARPGDVFRISGYRLSRSNAGKLVAANDDFWIASRPIGEKDQNGWIYLEVKFTIPLNYDSDGFKVYAWNNGTEPVFFDDLSIEQLDRELPSDFNMTPMYIYLSEEDKVKIEGFVKEALDQGILVNTDDSWVKALIFHGEAMMSAKIRLKGDWTDHLKGVKWSFRIKLGTEHSWNGMKTFSVQNPSTRSYLDEWMANEIFEKEDVLTPRYGFVPIFLNDVSLGLYAYEEHFEKQLVESKHRREGPIVRLAEDHFWEVELHENSGNFPVKASAVIEPFGSSKIIANESLYSQFLFAQRLVYDYQTLRSDVHQIFDMERMAKYCALVDLCSAEHGLNWHNLRFYYNPIVSRLEPIAFDSNKEYGVVTKASSRLEGLFKTDELYNNWNPHIMVRRLFSDSVFMVSYIHELEKVSDPAYLEDLFNEVNGELHELESKIRIENPRYAFDKTKLLDKAAYIREHITALSPSMHVGLHGQEVRDSTNHDVDYHPTTPKFFVNPYLSEGGKLKVFNFYPDSLHLIGLFKEEEIPVFFDEPIPMPPYGALSAHEVEVNINAKPGDKLAFKVVGHKEIHERQIIPWPHPNSYELERLEYNIPQDLFTQKDSLLIIKKGDYTLSEYVVIPSGHRVIVEAGVRLDFKDSSTLLSYSPLEINGTELEPVEMTSSDSSGFGLNVIQAKGKSKISHLRYSDMDAFHYGRWSLSGAINIYESDIEIDHLFISDNMCEDALNIIRSDFKVSHSTFERIFADAFDSDFSTGLLSDSWFKDVSNDAVDFSGSNVEIRGCKMEAIGDKGVSGGEGSSLSVADCTISGANIAVASKDRSEVALSKISMRNCNYGLVVFEKKPEYGPASIAALEVQWEGIETILLIEKESTITLDGKLVEGKKKNVASLFY